MQALLGYPYIQSHPFVLFMKLDEAKNVMGPVLRDDIDSFEDAWNLTERADRKTAGIEMLRRIGVHYISKTNGNLSIRSYVPSCVYVNPESMTMARGSSADILRREKAWEGYILFDEGRQTRDKMMSMSSERIVYRIEQVISKCMGINTWTEKCKVRRELGFDIPAPFVERFPTSGALITTMKIQKAEELLKRQLNLVEGRFERPMYPTMESNQSFDTEQASSIQMFSEHPVSILIGPAGSGKSTVVGDICTRFDSVVVAAPTNMAVERMKSIIQKRGVSCDAYTLHLMFYNKQVREKNRCVETLIVDECSMVEFDILGRTLSQYTFKRVLFVGDNAQLAPVSKGWFFQDILTRTSYPRVQLKGNYRSKAMNIIRNSRFIRDGYPAQVVVSPGEFDMIEMHNVNGHDSAQEKLTILAQQVSDEVARRNWAMRDTMAMCHTNAVNVFLNMKLQSLFNPRVPEEVFCEGKEIKSYKYERKPIRTPMRWIFRRGDRVMLEKNVNSVSCWLSESFSDKIQAFQEKHNITLQEHIFYLEDTDVPEELMSIYTEEYNDTSLRKFLQSIGYECFRELVCGKSTLGYVQEVTGGSVTVLFENNKTLTMKNTMHTFQHTSKDLHINNLCLAYSVTVHKAQGNEWKNVLFHLAHGWPGRNLAYTAITRAQESVCIVTPKVNNKWTEFKMCVNKRQPERETRLFL